MRRCLPIIIIVCITLSGCGLRGGIYANYRAVEDLLPVQTLGVDGGDGCVTLTVSAGQQESGGSPLVLSRSADGLLAAMDAAQDHAMRGELFFAHTQQIVLGRPYAEAGVGALLDFVERDVHMRLGTELFVLRSGDAEALFAGAAEAGLDLTQELAALREETEKRGGSHIGTFRETAAALSEYGAAAVCALRSAPLEGAVLPAQPGRIAVADGYGILRGDRLAGFLDGHEAEALSLLTGHLGTVTRSVPDGSGGEVTLEYGGSADVVPAWNADGSPAPLKINAELSAVIAEPDAAKVSDPETLAALSDALGAAVAADLRAVLETAQALDADFPALGGALRRSDAECFAALPGDWLQNLEFDVSVEAKIVHSYDLGDPVSTEGGAA